MFSYNYLVYPKIKSNIDIVTINGAYLKLIINYKVKRYDDER
jgi:hypothetical protein